MYARVARWEGSDPQAVRDMAEDVKKQAPSGALRASRQSLGRCSSTPSMAIMLFESEEQMRRAHEVLDAQPSPRDTGGRRVSVGMFEVAVDVRPSQAST